MSEQIEYARVEDGVVLEYPLFENHIVNRGLSVDSFVSVLSTLTPAFNSLTHKAQRDVPAFVEGKLYQTWQIVAKPAQQYGSDLLLKTEADTNRAINALKAGYPEQETETWTLQRIEAERYAEDNTVSVPTLENIATRKGVTLELLATSVLQKSQEYSVLLGMILGDRQAIEDAVTTLATNQPEDWIQQLDALREGWRSDWPTELR